MADTMRAAVFPEYGRLDLVEMREVDMPTFDDGQMLVRVRAAGFNAIDWRWVTGTPILLLRRHGGWLRPKFQRLGADFAGVVEAVGSGVTSYRPGDEVFGSTMGSFADYVRVREGAAVARKPSGLSFEQAAAVSLAAITALQGLRDHGRIQAGQRVLVNGASGGVGHFAVQIAKALGAEVTGVCSSRNLEMVRSLGADDVIDYTREDFTSSDHRYDLMLDNVGNKSWRQLRRVLSPEAILVMAGGPTTNRWIGPRGYRWRTRIAAWRDTRTVTPFNATMSGTDLEILAGMLESGKVRPVIDRVYRLDETAEALRYLGKEHVPGKLIITL